MAATVKARTVARGRVPAGFVEMAKLARSRGAWLGEWFVDRYYATDSGIWPPEAWGRLGDWKAEVAGQVAGQELDPSSALVFVRECDGDVWLAWVDPTYRFPMEALGDYGDEDG